MLSLGGGFNILIRSILVSLVEPKRIGILFNTIAVTETIGLITAGPLLSAAFRTEAVLGSDYHL